MTKRYKKYRKYKRRIEEIIWMMITMAGLFAASCVYAFHTAAILPEEQIEIDLSADFDDSLRSHSNVYANLKDLSIYADTNISTHEEKSDVLMNTAENETENISDINIDDVDDINNIDNTDNFETDFINTYDVLQDNGVEWRYRLTEHELNLIASLAMLEDSGAVTAISEVILNRVESGKFGGDTVSEVIYEKGQFYAAKFVDSSSGASEEAIKAVLAVFRDGVSIVGEAEFFAEKSVNPEKIAKGLYLIGNIGNTNFYGQK